MFVWLHDHDLVSGWVDAMSKFIIGMTGGIGSGKSTVMSLFQEQGIDCIDSDDIAREVVALGTEGLKGLVERYSTDILNQDQSLDRSKLRTLIFNDEAERIWLNQYLHPMIEEKLLIQAHRSTSSYVILVVPLLIESNWQSLVDKVLVIDLPTSLQKERACIRDQTSEQAIEKIIKTQVSRDKRCRHADDIIDNSGTIIELKKQVLLLDKKYRLLANI